MKLTVLILDAELRNVIYDQILDQVIFLPPYTSSTGTIRNSIRISNNANSLRPLAIAGSHTQVAHEFLSLLVFGDTHTIDTAAKLRQYGPRSLTNPNYVPEFRVFSGINVAALHCSSAAGLRISRHKDRCAICEVDRHIGISFTARYYVGKHIRLRRNDAQAMRKHVRACFSFKIDSDYEFTPTSRSLIHATFARIFQTNDNVSIENLAIAADRIMALRLDALRIDTRDDSGAFHQVTFEFCRGARDDRVELSMTPQRDAKVARWHHRLA